MADLDYAFIADFAKVESNGTLTAVGASWTHLRARSIPSSHRMAVAGRVRARVDEGPVTIRIDLAGPEGSFRLAADAPLQPVLGVQSYGDGYIGLLFALDVQVPLPKHGLYTIMISVNGEESRRLAFDVVPAPDEA